MVQNPRYERVGYMMIIYHNCKSLLYHVVLATKSWDTKSLSHERENTRPLWRVCVIGIRSTKFKKNNMRFEISPYKKFRQTIEFLYKKMTF